MNASLSTQSNIIMNYKSPVIFFQLLKQILCTQLNTANASNLSIILRNAAQNILCGGNQECISFQFLIS